MQYICRERVLPENDTDFSKLHIIFIQVSGSDVRNYLNTFETKKRPGYVYCIMIIFNVLKRAGAELIRFNMVNIMVVDVLDPCVARTSAPMILAM